jgi:integrase
VPALAGNFLAGLHWKRHGAASCSFKISFSNINKQYGNLLLGVLKIREKAMVFLDMPSRLRRGELAGLKWEDFDFTNLYVSVTRSLVDQHVGPVKSEASS